MRGRLIKESRCLESPLSATSARQGSTLAKETVMDNNICPKCKQPFDGVLCKTCTVGEVSVGSLLASDNVQIDKPEADPDAPTAFLVDLVSNRKIPVTVPRCRVGRDDLNDIVISGDQSISRFHFIITRENGQYFVQDAKSRHGTFLNGNQITAGPEIINDGDVLKIGVSLFWFVIETAVPEAAQPVSVDAIEKQEQDVSEKAEKAVETFSAAPAAEFKPLDTKTPNKLQRLISADENDAENEITVSMLLGPLHDDIAASRSQTRDVAIPKLDGLLEPGLHKDEPEPVAEDKPKSKDSKAESAKEKSEEKESAKGKEEKEPTKGKESKSEGEPAESKRDNDRSDKSGKSDSKSKEEPEPTKELASKSESMKSEKKDSESEEHGSKTEEKGSKGGEKDSKTEKKGSKAEQATSAEDKDDAKPEREPNKEDSSKASKSEKEETEVENKRESKKAQEEERMEQEPVSESQVEEADTDEPESSDKNSDEKGSIDDSPDSSEPAGPEDNKSDQSSQEGTDTGTLEKFAGIIDEVSHTDDKPEDAESSSAAQPKGGDSDSHYDTDNATDTSISRFDDETSNGAKTSMTSAVQESATVPEWTKKFFSVELKHLNTELEELNEQVRSAQQRIKEVESRVSMTKGLRNTLLASQGDELVEACGKILSLLGWKVKISDEDKSEIRLVVDQDEKNICIARVIRTKGQAERSHLGQLSISQTRHWMEQSVEPKGILIISKIGDTEPGPLSAADLNSELADYAAKKNVCLMSTLQLLGLYKDVALTDVKPESLRNSIMTSNGWLSGFSLEPGEEEAKSLSASL